MAQLLSKFRSAKKGTVSLVNSDIFGTERRLDDGKVYIQGKFNLWNH